MTARQRKATDMRKLIPDATPYTTAEQGNHFKMFKNPVNFDTDHRALP